MEPTEAIRKAAQILDEERDRPTVFYIATPNGDLGGAIVAFARQQDLQTERLKRPRPVHESSDDFQLKSINYELLLALFSQVSDNDRSAFINFLLSRIPESKKLHDLPLVTEFCIRLGYKQELIRAIDGSPLTAGLLSVLTRLEETIALNFNLFSDDELEQLATTLRGLRAKAYAKTYQSSRPRREGDPRTPNPEYDAWLAPIAKQIVAACDALVQQCQQARYWYLKGALQQNANLEINLDKTRVEGYLKSLGFSGLLLQALNAAEQDFRGSATPFELKNCLGHLRSFLEGLHEQACKPFAAKAGTVVPKKWGKSTEMLRNNKLLSVQEESLATSLYTLISDEGVHPLIAGREYARLLRNMVIEYGLMFLSKLEKAGITLH